MYTKTTTLKQFQLFSIITNYTIVHRFQTDISNNLLH